MALDTCETMGQRTVKPMDIHQAGSSLTHLPTQEGVATDLEGALSRLSLQQLIDLVVFYEVEARLRRVSLDDCDLHVKLASTATSEHPTVRP